MAATAAALSAYIQTYEPADTLKQLTNFGTNTTAAPNAGILEAACQKAINWFEQDLTDYDPDNYLVHQDIAHAKAMQALFLRTNNREAVADYEKHLQSLISRFRSQRALSPKSNATATPTVRVDAAPAFDDSVFDDIKAR